MGVEPNVPRSKLVVWCQSRHVKAKVAVCEGVEVLSPENFGSHLAGSRTISTDEPERVFFIAYHSVPKLDFELPFRLNIWYDRCSSRLGA